MTKQYPPLQNDEAKEYINKIREWEIAITVGLDRLIRDHEVFLSMSQFFESGLKILLFYLGGDVTVPKDVMDKYINSRTGEPLNIKCSPQEDGSWRVWSVLEKDDPLPEDEQSES